MQDAKSEQGVIAATIHYQGLLYRIVGKREETVSLPSVMSLGGLISSLSQRYGPEFECAVLTPAGELRPEVGILINGLNPVRRGGLTYPLAEENPCAVEIALLGAPLQGG
ncbi:MAG: MoaD/ThiS family protein [Nitrospinota bacterium]|jgi:hypothetical protein|nr:MoaD/ThiS family protein [Nitrospinota bacterium]MDP7385201.1 MoaD/ThiS family protein [Nitrospinota bacterium]